MKDRANAKTVVCKDCGVVMKKLMGTTGYGCLNCGAFYNAYTKRWGRPGDIYLDRLDRKDESDE